jgi:uncharacterized membrane protein
MEIGRLHVVIVHFPVALAVAAVVADVLWLIFRKDFFRMAGFYCLIFASASAIPAVITGDAHLDEENYASAPTQAAIAETHEDLGIAAMCVALAAAAVRVVRRNRPRKWWLAGYGVLAAALLVLITLTGHYGGMLSHGEDFLTLKGLFG